MKYHPAIKSVPFKEYMLNEATDPLLVVSYTCMNKQLFYCDHSNYRPLKTKSRK